MYEDRRWRKAARLFLDANPLCEKCGKVSQCVDHIIPHRGNVQLFWQVENFAALCFSCHGKKSAGERE